MIKPTFARIGATAAAVGMLAAGCGDNPDVENSSNRGSGSLTALTSVENAFIVPRFIPGRCAIQVGDAALLSFTATNNREAQAERLLGIDSPAAEGIRITPDATLEIPPQTSIAAGQPIEDVDRARDGADQPFTVYISRLAESATPGKSVDVTFRFEEQGDLVVPVPIEACPVQE